MLQLFVSCVAFSAQSHSQLSQLMAQRQSSNNRAAVEELLETLPSMSRGGDELNGRWKLEWSSQTADVNPFATPDSVLGGRCIQDIALSNGAGRLLNAADDNADVGGVGQPRTSSQRAGDAQLCMGAVDDTCDDKEGTSDVVMTPPARGGLNATGAIGLAGIASSATAAAVVSTAGGVCVGGGCVAAGAAAAGAGGAATGAGGVATAAAAAGAGAGAAGALQSLAMIPITIAASLGALLGGVGGAPPMTEALNAMVTSATPMEEAVKGKAAVLVRDAAIELEALRAL